MNSEQHPVSTVLLIEDDLDHAFFMLEAVREYRPPVHAVHVSSAAEALCYLRRENEYATARRPSLITLDLNMPGCDGLSVLDAIKSDVNLRSIPVVVISTSQSPAERQAARVRYANSFLVKPAAYDEFYRMMHNCVRYWVHWDATDSDSCAAA